MTRIIGEQWTRSDFKSMKDAPTGIKLTALGGEASDISAAYAAMGANRAGGKIVLEVDPIRLPIHGCGLLPFGWRSNLCVRICREAPFACDACDRQIVSCSDSFFPERDRLDLPAVFI